MNCISFLRKIGLWPRRRATIEDIAQASTENAARENEKAFQEISEVYRQGVPEATQKLKTAIDKANTPFADLENLMHNGRIAGRLRRGRN